jgi:hypothetical protein
MSCRGTAAGRNQYSLHLRQQGNRGIFRKRHKNYKKNAYQSKDILKQRLKATLPAEEYELLDFKISYNHTGGAVRDFLNQPSRA